VSRYTCRVLIVAAAALLALPPLTATASPPPRRPLPGCTTAYAYDGQRALAGNNEDFNNPLTRVWFVPASPGRFGCVYFGYEDGIPQGGLNDQGVFFDALALPYKATPLTSARPAFPGGELVLLEEILSKSATAEDAVEIASQWNRAGSEFSQLFYGDRTGNSVIIDGDTVVRIDGNVQLATNFRITDTPGPPYADERYETLRGLLEGAPRYDVELFRRAMDATHQEGDFPTLYSQVYELDSNTIHLFQFHEFDDEVVLQLDEELARGPRNLAISSLFPVNAERDKWAADRLAQCRASYEARIATGVDAASLEWMCGEYALGSAPLAGTAKVYLEDEHLYMRVNNQVAVELFPTASDTVFHQYVSGLDVTLTFQRDERGDATGAKGRMSFDPYGLAVPYDLARQEQARPPVWPTVAVVAGCIAILALGASVFLRRRAVRGH